MVVNLKITRAPNHMPAQRLWQVLLGRWREDDGSAAGCGNFGRYLENPRLGMLSCLFVSDAITRWDSNENETDLVFACRLVWLASSVLQREDDQLSLIHDELLVTDTGRSTR